MANKVRLNCNGGFKELKLGRTFNKNCVDESYHTIRYDFKPASVDSQKDGTLEVVDKEVTLTVPMEGCGSAQAAVFKGNKTSASKDCLLIINHETGEFVLERISQHIRVKKTRTEAGSKKVLPRGPPQPEARPQKGSPSQGLPASSSHLEKPSSSHAKSPGHKTTSNKTRSTAGAPGSMPMLGINFEEESKHGSIMSDSSSDSDSNSGSSSPSDSDSESEAESGTQTQSQSGTSSFNTAATKKSSPSILSDLELSEED